MCAALLCSFGAPADDEFPANRYPTQALVEFVNVCIATHGDSLSSLYQCSCVIDRIAGTLSYDAFVEASTYAKYSGLPGEGGGIFRDSDKARQLAKSYRELEAEAYRACGLEKKQ
jgi:hypothetical protein